MSKWRLLAAGAVLSVAACSQGDVAGDNVAETSYEPDISPTSAPGVAFEYENDYQLADEAISSVQEAHAAACERLGVTRCRITGLRYSVTPEKAVSAMLQVKLAPEIARAFGKAATEQVKKADGQLLRMEFTGEDTEPLTSAANRDKSDVESRIAALEEQLASAKSAQERAQITSQLNDLRSSLAEAKGTIARATERLASTPMTFNYYGRGGVTGFKGNPIRESGRLLVSSVVTMVTVVLKGLAIILPWAVLLALLVAIARSRAGRAARAFLAPRRDERDGDAGAAV